jgi:ornithine decarboxylase
MKKMKVAINEDLRRYILTERQTVSLDEADLTEVSAVVFNDKDAPEWIKTVRETGFAIPTFVVHSSAHPLTASVLGKVRGIFNYDLTNAALYGRQVDSIAQDYEDKLLPPFFDTLVKYVAQGDTQFDCPGHQGGEYYRRHPAGREFYNFFGENVFRADVGMVVVPRDGFRAIECLLGVRCVEFVHVSHSLANALRRTPLKRLLTLSARIAS